MSPTFIQLHHRDQSAQIHGQKKCMWHNGWMERERSKCNYRSIVQIFCRPTGMAICPHHLLGPTIISNPSKLGQVELTLMEISSSYHLTSKSRPLRMHNLLWYSYIGGATQPGVTLQGTLMNHTSTVRSISSQLALRNSLKYTKIPFILGEANSLYNQGKPGLSNSFGAAIWVLDFNLWCASQNISRVHMHQGTNYRYQSWRMYIYLTSIVLNRAAVSSLLPNLYHKTSLIFW